MNGYQGIAFRAMGMIWLAQGIARILFQRSDFLPYVIVGLLCWLFGVGLAYLLDQKVEYATTPSAFAGGLMGCAIWGYVNNQSFVAHEMVMTGLLILTINFYLIFVRKWRY